MCIYIYIYGQIHGSLWAAPPRLHLWREWPTASACGMIGYYTATRGLAAVIGGKLAKPLMGTLGMNRYLTLVNSGAMVSYSTLCPAIAGFNQLVCFDGYWDWTDSLCAIGHVPTR